ncbi:hypothetical protein N9T02_00515 [Candidatus Actinomarina]|nr:hypothetical protein [Candidatus Actinomarina sp.]
MNINVTRKELAIIKKALSDLINHQTGISEAQEAYIRNIDAGMSTENANEQFLLDNKDDWDNEIKNRKNPLFILFYNLFLSE